ncbi:hypothetical protein SAMN04487886_10922 [Clostridium sp. DSM 8431]|uniref:hypothetical protein n=1 Tax=Clostridium sp. DSM 8431 TaxID=1761781 RepID=UPI0008F05BF5|nr:hypothetical protein [Clostridium sp. DSM 8431]SFU66085.1 hypothetical protein SAMN04487886_10922 [Clostridium sp. DSM 8431]
MALSFSEVNKFKKDSKEYILKVAKGKEMDVTVSQIKYLLDLQPNLKDKFPKVESYNIEDDKVTYVYPFYDLNMLDKVLVDNDEDVEILEKLLSEVVTFMCKEVYTLENKPADKSFFNKKYLTRIEDRVQYLLTERKDLKKLITSDKIKINGKFYLNIHECMKLIKESSKLQLLIPSKLCKVHGDLLAEHILYDAEDNSKFILIDPRCDSEGGDVAYDLAKLYQSIEGEFYEFISGNFEYEYNYEKEIPVVNFKVKTLRNSLDYERLRITPFILDKIY